MTVDGVPAAVYWARPSRTPTGLADLVLPPAERDRMGRYRQAADQARFLTAWAMARTVLAALVGGEPAELPVRRTCHRCANQEHGKPVLPGGPEFSLSHAGDRVLLAVTDAGHPVGVDVEEAGRLLTTEISRMVLHPDEVADLAASPVPDALLRYWVRKEAILKATGDGLSAPMPAIAVTPPDQPARVLARPRAGHVYRGGPLALADLPDTGGYLASVAVLDTESITATVTEWSYQPAAR